MAAQPARPLATELHRARTIAVVYAAFGLLWLLFSDDLLGALIPGRHPILSHAIQGLVFVAITVAAFYWFHRHSAEAIRLSRSLFRTIVEQNILGIYVIQDGRFRYVNPVAAHFFGYYADEVLSMPLERFIAPQDRERVLAHLRERETGEVATMHYSFTGLKRSGEPILLEVHGSRVDYDGRPAVLGVLLDVTEQRKREALYAQAQRFEAIGRLAAGVAHDFNNLLTAIAGSAAVLGEHVREAEARDEIDEIFKTTERGASLTRQLLTFSRSRPSTQRTVDLNRVVAHVEKLVRRLLDSRIRLTVAPVARVLPVSVDPAQIEQVIVNLAVNAQDAMPEAGELTISTERITDSRELPFGSRSDVAFIALSVADTGVGMAPDVKERIFEPFFTTKETSGTGLGLSTVHGIIEQFGGRVAVDSEPGAGTTFSVYLPESADEVSALFEEEVQTPAAGDEPRLNILVVEDQEPVLRVVRRALERGGHSVRTAHSAEEALSSIDAILSDVDLLVADEGLPGRSGSALAHDLLERRPGLPVLLMSGYSPERLELGAAHFLEKPFTPDDLLRKVGEAVLP